MLRSLSSGLTWSPSRLARLVAAAPLAPASLVVVAVTRVALTCFSLAVLRQRMLPAAPPTRYDPAEVRRVALSVRIASCFIPFASCLTQAQSCQILLARRGIASTLCLGVRENGRGGAGAHAWLVCQRRLVLGGAPERIVAFRLLAELGPVR
jgi:hypothetical protein